jgi:hypothetical protein
MPILRAKTEITWEIEGLDILESTSPFKHQEVVNDFLDCDWKIVSAHNDTYTLRDKTVTVKVRPLEACVALGLINPEVLK